MLFLLINILVGCNKNDVLTIEVHNLDNRVFELGEDISFNDSYITVVYCDGHSENIPLTSEYINAFDLYNAFKSTGEKKLNIFFEDNEGNIHIYESTIVIIANQTKESYISELSEYKKDVIYSDQGNQIINNIKTSYSILIKNSSKEDALVLLDIAKQEIDNINTKAEEDSLITLEELAEEVEKLENDLNILINYEDSTIKTEINNLNEKLEALKEDLNNEQLENEISNIKLSLTALEASVNNIKANVEKNNKLILSLTETINNYLSNFVTKEELENKIDDIKLSYESAIEVALNQQKVIVELRVNDGYIEYRYNNSNVFEKLLDVSSLDVDEIQNLNIEENGVISVRLRNGNVLTTNSVYDNNIDCSVYEEVNVETNNIKDMISDYFDLYYNYEKYDYVTLKNVLDTYYDGFVEYANYTHYDDIFKVNELLNELNEYLENEFNLSNDSFKKIITIEKELKELDTNLNICKSYFATLLSNECIEEYRKEAYINRILTTSSIEKIIELYEQALC